ncbi:Uncharacterised protein [Mycobacterium tuberculosis]|nr:Uncharacterised protein [Mycobacterium tuberculosis]
MRQHVVIGRGQLTTPNPASQCRAVLDDQGIRGHMIHTGLHRGVH